MSDVLALQEPDLLRLRTPARREVSLRCDLCGAAAFVVGACEQLAVAPLYDPNLAHRQSRGRLTVIEGDHDG